MQNILIYLPTNSIFLMLLGLVTVFALIWCFWTKKSHFILYGLLIWLPFESLVLRYTPVDYYSYVKYTPEVLLYLLFFGAWIAYAYKYKKFIPQNPLTKWFLAYIIAALFSLILNYYSSFIWVLGLRQVLRFALVIFVLLFANYSKSIQKNFVYLAVSMFVIQAFLGLIQYLSGGALDAYLFPSRTIGIGSTAILGGIEQFWAPGTRVFATMGRYDRLGSFLALGLIMLFPFSYYFKNSQKKFWYFFIFFLILIALFFTSSRASWLAALAGIVFIGIFLRRDRKVLKRFVIFVSFVALYLFGSLIGQNISNVTESRDQSTAERIVESFSYRAWLESYDGNGRIFFIINTPRVIVPQAFFFGHGPGNYGGGVAASLLNTSVYDRLGIPFGIENRYGQIDNSWFSVWGELGTIGLLVWIGVFVSLIKTAKETSKRELRDKYQLFSEGVAGAVIGIVVLGFFGPYFEFRALMFYFWLMVGIAVLRNTQIKQRGNFLYRFAK